MLSASPLPPLAWGAPKATFVWHQADLGVRLYRTAYYPFLGRQGMGGFQKTVVLHAHAPRKDSTVPLLHTDAQPSKPPVGGTSKGSAARPWLTPSSANSSTEAE